MDCVDQSAGRELVCAWLGGSAMIRTAYRIASWTILLGVTAIAGCSSDDDDDDSDATGGATGTGGSGAGGECTTPPVTDHGKCSDIPSEKSGDSGFAISSPDFSFCGEMPASLTCDGKDRKSVV